jgi:hypothetical protein
MTMSFDVLRADAIWLKATGVGVLLPQLTRASSRAILQ